eukprot:7482856-Heterocapsa_arctica.AAC.1
MICRVGCASIHVGLHRVVENFRGRHVDIQWSPYVHCLEYSAQPQVWSLRRDLPSVFVLAIELVLGSGPDPLV